MNIFVLTTGRTGSKTFARACRHIEGFSVGHESRARIADGSRLTYPDKHIEVDPRLAFFLGDLDRLYPDAHYVHLVRDEEATARSFVRRWEGESNIARAWKESVLMGGMGCSPYDAALQYVRATNANIRAFWNTVDCNRRWVVPLEDLKGENEVKYESPHGFLSFIEYLDGDCSKALAEFDIIDAS